MKTETLVHPLPAAASSEIEHLPIAQVIVAALRKNLLPGLVLQLFAGLILLTYFFVPSAKPVFSWFGEQKNQFGFGYSFVATAIFGGIIPFIYLWQSKGLNAERNPFGLLFFYSLFWGLKGMEVDLFYRFQGNWFGYGNDWQTLAIKVAVDQFIYSALWAAPGIAICYLWMEHGYHFRTSWQAMNRRFFLVKMPTVILSNWLVWIPAVSIVYAMPNELQIPLFNLVLCFWVLLLAVLNKK
jgi:hypothetical protein